MRKDEEKIERGEAKQEEREEEKEEEDAFELQGRDSKKKEKERRENCTKEEKTKLGRREYLGSGRTIFLLARAAGVHLLFSMAIK